MTIDKKTFDIIKMDLDFVLKMEVKGIATKIDTTTSTIYSDFNKVEAITIPQEVLNTAVESPF